MFFYIYVDMLGFYTPGYIEAIMIGEFAGITITPAFQLTSIIIMAIPSFMVFISLALKAKVNRWVNLILGIFHVVLALSVVFVGGSMAFGLFGTIAEVVVLSLIVWYAWKWPRLQM
jgi:hypothetical protein